MTTRPEDGQDARDAVEPPEPADDVAAYIDAITPEHRPLFDRLHRLVLEVHPEATLVLSYRMPTYRVGPHKLHVGAWKHGLSVYGWHQGREEAFTSRYPGTKTSTGTIRLTPEDFATVSDDDLVELVRAALDD